MAIKESVKISAIWRKRNRMRAVFQAPFHRLSINYAARSFVATRLNPSTRVRRSSWRRSKHTVGTCANECVANRPPRRPLSAIIRKSQNRFARLFTLLIVWLSRYWARTLANNSSCCCCLSSVNRKFLTRGHNRYSFSIPRCETLLTSFSHYSTCARLGPSVSPDFWRVCRSRLVAAAFKTHCYDRALRVRKSRLAKSRHCPTNSPVSTTQADTRYIGARASYFRRDNVREISSRALQMNFSRVLFPRTYVEHVVIATFATLRDDGSLESRVPAATAKGKSGWRGMKIIRNLSASATPLYNPPAWKLETRVNYIPALFML